MAHLQREDDILVKVEPLRRIVPDWAGLLASDLPAEENDLLRSHERTGRPLDDAVFLDKLERFTSRVLRRRKPGPKKK